MARSTTRVSRGDRLGFDEALVGGPDDAVQITIDPSELANNPNLGTSLEGDEDWDVDRKGNGHDDERPEGDDRTGDEGRDRDGDRRPDRRRAADDDRERAGGDEGDDEDDARLAYDEDVERGSSRRRARRNRSKRNAIDGRDQMIANLRQEVQQTRAEMNQALQSVVGGQFQLSARDVQTRIEQHRAAIDRADAEMAKSVTDSDGATYIAIQRERDKIARELWGLESYQGRMVEHAQRMARGGDAGEGDGQGQQRQRQPNQQELAVAQQQNTEFERMRDVFMDRYAWFDPEGGNDPDHRLVKRLDREVAAEGLEPHTREFWHRMEELMADEGFRPERPRRGRDDDDRLSDRDEDRGFQTRRVREDRGNDRRSRLPPTGAVRGGGRANNGGGAFRLSEVQVDILEGEGLSGNNLSKEEQAKRDRIINKWKTGAQQLERARR